MRNGFFAILAAGAILAACQQPGALGDGGSDGGGIAAAPTPLLPAAAEAHMGNSVVFFEYDRHILDGRARGVLDRQAAWLRARPGFAVSIEGHADERGTREYNLALGERRANAVKDYLVSQGVPARRIATISYGKERPLAPGDTEAAWTQNRRAATVAH